MNSSDDSLAERSLNRTLSISSQGCPDSSKYNTSSSLQPSTEPFASFPLRLVQGSTKNDQIQMGGSAEKETPSLLCRREIDLSKVTQGLSVASTASGSACRIAFGPLFC